MTKHIIVPGGWQGITKVGQRVINVIPLIANCRVVRYLPQVGLVYTVAGFADCPGVDCPEEERPGIYLNEVKSAYCGCGEVSLPFPMIAFRPVDTVEKKSEVITKMLADILRKTKIDTRVPEDV